MADLLLNQLKGAIAELLEKKGLKGSVLVKVNHRGEQVVAAVLNEVCPHCRGTGRKTYAADDATPSKEE